MLDNVKNLLPAQTGATPEREMTSGPEMEPDTAAPADPAPTDPLEAFFERLDSAFAGIGQKDYRSQPRPLDPSSGEEPAPPASPEVSVHSEPVHTHLATAFAALLAAEQGLVPLQPGALVPPVAMIPDEVIERIVERVLARLAEDPIRRP